MQQGNTVFELKGEARRLRDALAEMKLDVTHTAALNLLARAKGSRNWETLEAELAAKHQREVAAQVQAKSQAESDKHWLQWLEAALRMRDVTEVDLDDMVHDIMGEDEASDVNNNGLSSQLEAMLEWHSDPDSRTTNPRRDLVHHLEDVISDLELPLPETKTANERFGFGMNMEVSVCSGSPFEKAMKFDALEWFATHSVKEISALVRDGLRNSEASDQVVLWLAEHSLDEGVRSQLGELLSYMQSICAANDGPTSDVVGLTVALDPASVVAYVDALRGSGVHFDEDVRDELGMR